MKNRLLGAIICALCLVCFFPLPTLGYESKTPITYTSNEYTSYRFQLESIGNGSVYDGEQMIKNGIVEYGLHIEEVKTFKLIPDSGYEVAHIYFTEYPHLNMNSEPIKKDLISQMKDDVISIKAVGGVMLLQVEFAKQSDITKPNTPSQSDNQESTVPSVNTGDVQSNVLFTWLLVIAYIIVLSIRHARYGKHDA